MAKEGYVTEQALVARRVALDGVICNLNLVFDWYDEHGLLPRKNLSDKYETKLNNFFRRFDLDKYINDLDPKMVKKIIHVRKENEIRLKRLKTKKSLMIKQAYISKCIKEYYDFYVKNGRFPGESKKSEYILANAYNNILRDSKYFTHEHVNMINNITMIKNNNRNIKKLLHIKRYTDFCIKHERRPLYVERYDEMSLLEKRERALAVYITHKLNLDNVYVPYALLEKFYGAIDYADVKSYERRIKDVNDIMEELLLFMETNNRSCDNKRLSDIIVLGHNKKEVRVANALSYVKEYIEYVDDDKIERYNAFSFIRKPLSKVSNK